MRNLLFLIWMLGFAYLQWGVRQRPTFSSSTDPEAVAYGVGFLIIWFGVGYFLYEEEPEKPEQKESNES